MADKANELLKDGNKDVKRIPYEKALKTSNIHEFDFVAPYVNDLHNIIDMDVIKASGLKIGADALGGAGIGYWMPIAEKYGLNIEMLNGYCDQPLAL